MSHLKKISDILFTRVFLNKVLAYFLLIMFLITFKSFISVFLMIFIFSYLFYSSAKFLKKSLDVFFENFLGEKSNFFKKFFSLNFIIIFLYLFFLILSIFIVSNMIPKLIGELSSLSKTMPFLSEYITDFLDRLKELINFNSEISNNIKELVSSQDFSIFWDIFNRLKSVSVLILKLILSFFLSFVFLLDREKLFSYLENIKKSNFKFLYKEYKIIFDKVVRSLGIVIQAQASIAFFNTVLTAIGLTAIGFLNSSSQYPYFLALILIVFICGFIPVIGTFISSIPIIIVGYSAYPFRGISIIFELIILITIIHMIETYFLNPKIVSKAISVPISITFIILLLSENLFGPAGLILGMSLFYFITGLLVDINQSMNKKKIEKNSKN